MRVKKLIAISAAILAISCMSFNVYADRITERDGLKYLISDNGEEKGLYSGWTKKGNDYYYYKNGERKKNCWLTSKGVRKYFLQADGKRAAGKVTIQGVEYVFDEKGVIVPDEWGLTLTTKDVTPTSCTIVFTQFGDDVLRELSTDTDSTIERYENGEWNEVKWIISKDDLVWTGAGLTIDSNDPLERKEEWKEIYGELPSGYYRICKNVFFYHANSDTEKKIYYAYFKI